MCSNINLEILKLSNYDYNNVSLWLQFIVKNSSSLTISSYINLIIRFRNFTCVILKTQELQVSIIYYSNYYKFLVDVPEYHLKHIHQLFIQLLYQLHSLNTTNNILPFSVISTEFIQSVVSSMSLSALETFKSYMLIRGCQFVA